jgi:glycerol-3-phosphate O-acyltransferase
MTLEDIMPGFHEGFALRKLEHLKESGRFNRWVDDLRVVGAEDVLRRIRGNSVLFYDWNHQTQLDYFIPNAAILNEGLPYPRTIVGDNLNHWLFKKFMWNFQKYGVLWHKRDSQNGMRDYVQAVIQTFNEGRAVSVFPEGGRNREIRGTPNDFLEGIFRVVLKAQEHLPQREILVCSSAIDYENIPERGYYDKIDKKGFRSFSYFFWDLVAYRRWIKKEKKRGIATVKFGKPVPILELAGDGSMKERSRRVADKSVLKITEMLQEIRSIGGEGL